MKKQTKLPKSFIKAFKPYDIRGIYPTEINEEVAYRSGKAFAKLFKPKKMVIGHDMRISSPSLSKAVIKGLIDQGVDVWDIGLVNTPQVYFVSGKYNIPGVMITASHNPKQYNGIKYNKKGAAGMSWNSGLSKMLKLVKENKFPEIKRKGRVTKKNVMKEYKAYLKKFVNLKPPRKIKIVVGAGSGMASKIVPPIYKDLPITMKKIHFKLDGRFPYHTPNPTVPENTKVLRNELKKGKYDLGIAFDGDMDRVVFFDEKGNAVSSSVTGALLTKYFLQKNKGKKSPIARTVLTSKIMPQTIKKYGGKDVRINVGQSRVKEGMRKAKAILGVEHSAHFYFKDNYYADSGLIASIIILNLYAQTMREGEKFSNLVKEFQIYSKAQEVLIRVRDKDKILKMVENKYKKRAVKIDHFDQLTIYFKDFWFNIRKSGTEDAMKINLEANDKETMERELRKLLKFVRR